MSTKAVKIAPSILSANLSVIGEEVKKLVEAGAEIIHLDVMDGHFVPNITFGPGFIEDLGKHVMPRIILDVHLMIENPDLYIKEFANVISDIPRKDVITVHYESTIHINRTIGKIRSLGLRAGIALIPTTDENVLKYLLDEVDLILVMTVSPGYGGQNFMESQLKKIRNIKKIIDESGRKIDLEVDGGINRQSGKLARDAGANILVAGSYIFGSYNYRERIDSLKNLNYMDKA
ncbi:MAG: ribulose-phosphate 3-epimerase [Rickettsiales bacterium]|jgi:ribulose-phosphate 3-epimerase|nr:ribulose-phosphate 3-epimerase [Rickettsiales bacterium]